MIAFKLRSRDVPAIPQPAPLFEIYVYSPAMEGIHLRGGKVARGGLRWSDRQDYRTEVYGLMRAQVTKNAVIVPAGAKGGFYLKDPPAGREELKAEVERQYVRFVGGLLELTDNLVEGEVVHPEHVRVLDEDDTYLVVAADKGTATFSDTANARLARSAASGSATRSPRAGRRATTTRRSGSPRAARGSRSSATSPSSTTTSRRSRSPWSASATCPATCSATGCCCSEQIRLVAAYDHRHVFIDPDPDAATRLRRAQAAVRAPGLLVGRLRPREDLRGRRRVAARGQVDHAVAAGARGARDRGRAAHAQRRHPRDPARAGRPALERRHRHRRQGLGGDRRGREGPRVGRDPRRRARPALPRDRRGRQPRPDAPRPRGVRRGRRARQRGLHRQLGRRRLLRPRGQPEDPARARRARAASSTGRAATRCCATSPTTSSPTCSTTRSCRRRSSPRRSRPRRRGCTPTRT